MSASVWKMTPEQREKRNANARKRYRANPEKALAQSRAWSKANPEKSRERSRKWYKANLERARTEERKRRMKNRGETRIKERRWRGLPEPTRSEPPLCEMCNEGPKGKCAALCLDHCHETGIFRGWLCQRCNRGLGLLGDNLPAVIARLQKYSANFDSEVWLAIPGDGLP